MKLYIANCTSQRLDFAFRIPGRLQSYAVPIAMGSQSLAYSGEMTRDEIDYVLEKGAVFGLVPIEEAEKTPGFSGLCYSIDRPMTEDRIRRAMDKRTGVLIDMGKEIRKAAGVGTHNLLEDHLNEHRGLANLHGLKTEIIEQSPAGGSSGGLEERYHFTETDQPFVPSPPSGRRTGHGGKRSRAA